MLRLFGLAGFLFVTPFAWVGAFVTGDRRYFETLWRLVWKELQGENR